MNNYTGELRNRNQTLLIVEGNHEKNKLFWLIFKCFHEINIDMNNVWIYGTNIYLLYEDIAKEYGTDWAEEEIDIDLPFVISKKQTPDSLKYKDDFTNIVLVFDYERHDTNFSPKKILDLQSRFSDSTDMGKLYINYPMIESYEHLKSLPDPNYSERKIPISLQPGKKYKALVRNETVIESVFSFPHRINDLMDKRYGITNAEIRQKCCDDILNISDGVNLEDKLMAILQDAIASSEQSTLKHQLRDWVSKVGYPYCGLSYWQFARNIFVDIVYHNIYKANRIQTNCSDIESNLSKDCFEQIDLSKILTIQNELSQDSVTGYIWVLNTCVFLIPDYNFALLQRDT